MEEKVGKHGACRLIVSVCCRFVACRVLSSSSPPIKRPIVLEYLHAQNKAAHTYFFHDAAAGFQLGALVPRVLPHLFMDSHRARSRDCGLTMTIADLAQPSLVEAVR